MAALERVCAYARDVGLLVVLDAKRGDIGSTARAYAAAYLEPREDEPALADALTVNTYLGHDSVEPFLQACRLHGAGIFCLVRTSNAGAADVQELALSDGSRVWQHVARLVAEWGQDLVGERGLSSVGAVVGATVPARGRRGAPAAAAVRPAAAGRGCPGGDPGGRRPGVHERAGERPCDRRSLRHLRVPRRHRRLACRGGRRGGAAPQRGMDGVGLVSGHRSAARVAASAAFLAAAVVAVLLVRSALSNDSPSQPAAPGTTTQSVGTTTGAAVTLPQATTAVEPEFYVIESGDTLETVAEEQGTTVERLLILNPDVDPVALTIGQRIRVK